MKKSLAAFVLILACSSCMTHGDITQISDDTCPVHFHKFKKAIVKVHYGFACPRTAVDSLNYPFPKPIACGGCVVGITNPKFARVKYCSTCQKVKEKQM